MLTVAAAGPRSSSLVSYPSEQEVVKCSLWLQLVPEEEIRRWLGAYFTTIPVRKAAVQRSLWAQLLQENDVGRWSGTDFTAPTRPKKEAVKCSLGLQLVQEIPTSGVSHELLDRTAAVVVETGPGFAIVPEPASQPYRTTRKPSTTHKTRKSASAHCGCSCESAYASMCSLLLLLTVVRLSGSCSTSKQSRRLTTWSVPAV